MKYVDLTLPTPELNLACDEALLDWAEAGFETGAWPGDVPTPVPSGESPDGAGGSPTLPTLNRHRRGGEWGEGAVPTLGPDEVRGEGREGQGPFGNFPSYKSSHAGLELLRFWEPAVPFVVLGYSNRASREVNLEVCRAKQIPVLRRCSGGGTVLQGPGCLNYSLVLEAERNEALATISGANAFIMQAHRQALGTVLNRAVEVRGHTDLALGDLKFSGNAQRRKRRYLLFHGTFLLDFDLSLVEELLSLPSKEPAYRQQRAHRDFLVNLGLKTSVIKEALKNAWHASELLDPLPLLAVEKLAREKYSDESWNLKFA